MKYQRFLVQLLDIRHDGAFPGCSFPKLAQGLEVPHHQRRKVPPVLRNTFFPSDFSNFYSKSQKDHRTSCLPPSRHYPLLTTADRSQHGCEYRAIPLHAI